MLTKVDWLSIAKQIQRPYQELVDAVSWDVTIPNTALRLQIKAGVDCLIALRGVSKGAVNFGILSEFCKRTTQVRSPDSHPCRRS